MEKILQIIRDILALLLGQRGGGGRVGAATRHCEGVATRSEGLVFEGEAGEGHGAASTTAGAHEREQTNDFWSSFANGTAQETAVISNAENQASTSAYTAMEWGSPAVLRTHQNTPTLER